MSTQLRAPIGLGQGQPVGHRLQVGRPPGRVGVQQVDPTAHLGQHHIMLGKGPGDIGDPLPVVELDRGAIGGRVTQLLVGQGHLFGVLQVQAD